VLKRFAAVMYDVGKWANAHHAETVPILAKYAKLTPETIGGMIRSDFAEQLRLNEIQPLLDSGAKFGFLSRPVSAAELLPK
jgi:hypothetical protein